MAVIFKCDHCGKPLEEPEVRRVTISSKSFELCDSCKFDWEKLKNNFFNIKSIGAITGPYRKGEMLVKKYE